MDWISLKDRKEEKRGRIYMAVRTIIFRGKRIDNGEWVEGAYMPYYYSTRYGKVAAIFTNDDVLCKTCRYPVDPSTVGQYTGLKDKNGKRIFDGDMIKPFDDDIDKMVVEFHNGQFLLCLYGERGYMAEYGWEEEGNYGCFEAEPLSSYGDDIEVIGNIHDNPELLEVR